MAKTVYVTTTINRNVVKNLIHSIEDGKMFGITFARRTPKCKGCGRSLKSFIGKDTCHFCGSELSKERITVAQKGVENPSNPSVTKPGKGVFQGASAEVAEAKWDVLKFYDVNAINKDGSKGGYRSCGYPEIKSIRKDGVEYIVI